MINYHIWTHNPRFYSLGQGPPAHSTKLSRTNSAPSTASTLPSKSTSVVLDCLFAELPGATQDQGLGGTRELYSMLKKAKYNSLEEQEAREKAVRGELMQPEEQLKLLEAI